MNALELKIEVLRTQRNNAIDALAEVIVQVNLLKQERDELKRQLDEHKGEVG